MSLLSVRDLDVAFPTRRGVVHAVNGVSFDMAPGETVGLVGESGCGKSTLGRAIMRLVPIAAGEVSVAGRDITHLGRRAMRSVRPLVQMIFQDSLGALNPRATVGRSIAQPLVVAGWARDRIRARVETLLSQVGLPRDAVDRFPHEFSGGQRQRIGIARALALEPKLVICDEPVSALDVSVRAQVVNLLANLKAALGVSYLFISHDLSVVEHVADRVMVMYLGRIVESGTAETIWHAPRHPYTKALLAAVPSPDPAAQRKRATVPPLQGELPSPLAPPSGCPFHTRCPIAVERCRRERPVLEERSRGASVACHLAA